ncbi:uncharacterized protein LOC112505989 [Cynara cardunculus var. scolymus]|uniref:uncharacterized protein LOC112505989 n=1 Tax=Cynara cardunculus var. scolymus TaxID=59895 RepID=UPI000D6254D5|nr:uncharacterized protein LOC112505989 [Cynara cardunculus var. scolymus]
MVNTRSRRDTSPEGHAVTESTADQPPRITISRVHPRQDTWGGGVEQVPQVDLATTNPIMEEETPESRMMGTMMNAMNRAMAQQQEFFMKLLEDRDANNRKHEAVAENVTIVGSEGTGNGIPTQELATIDARQVGRICSYKTFLSCKPSEFDGSDDPVACMNWLREIEQAFRGCDCDEGEKTRFGSQMLRGAALTWWNIVISTLETTELAKMSWVTLKKKVLEEFCNEQEMDRIEEEFRTLKKGNLSVGDYTRLFMEKLNLVGHVAPMEKERMKAYLKGLPADMMVMVRNSRASTLREAIEEAKVMESVFAKGREERTSGGEKRRWEGHLAPSKRSNHSNSNNRGAYPRHEAKWCPKCCSRHHGPCSTNPTPTKCFKCGKSGHTRNECPLKGPICFGCGEPGHFKSDCQKLKTGGSQGRREGAPKATGRAFQMTREEAKASTDVVSGTFLVNSVPAHVLFDSGASCSFVSRTFYQLLHTPPSTLEDDLTIELANGSRVLVHEVVRDCVLGIEGEEFRVDLIPMTIGRFDIIIGMDWLAKNQAEILCFKKLIRIPLSSGGVVLVYGERKKGDVVLLSVAKARKCLAKGYPSFIAYVMDAKLKKKRIEEVNVVNEFLDVFPEDLPGLPPVR